MRNERDRWERVRLLLSTERLEPYFRVAEGRLLPTFVLYEWNIAISGAFFESLSILEVVIRNAMNAQLRHLPTASGQSWYEDPHTILSREARRDIGTARRRLEKLGRPETHGGVVAELNFGFWKYMVVTSPRISQRSSISSAGSTSTLMTGRKASHG